MNIEKVSLSIDSAMDCGGYNVWIELNQSSVNCNTSIIDDFYPGNVLTWSNEDLGSCQEMNFAVNASEIGYNIKTNKRNAFCPVLFEIFIKNSHDVYYNDVHYKKWYKKSTNDINHTAIYINTKDTDISHGFCDKDVCHCKPGFQGKDCSYPVGK